MAVVGRLASDGWMDGEKVIKSLCQYSTRSPLLLSPLTLDGRSRVWGAVGTRTIMWIDGRRGGVECVCEREMDGRGRFGQIFSLPFFTGKRGVAVAE